MICTQLLLAFLSLVLAASVTCTDVRIITDCIVPGTAALTFDDGPHVYTEEVSHILTKHGAKGTFFFNGRNYGCINDPVEAARVKAVFDAGHQVASHTWGHKNLTNLSKEEVINELVSISAAIQRITGKVPAQMRPPYGSYNDNVLEVANAIGQDIVLWNLDSGDSMGVSTKASELEYANRTRKKHRPILALNHETHKSSVKDVLPKAIKILRNAGYRLVSVAECTRKPPYLKNNGPPLPPSNLTC